MHRKGYAQLWAAGLAPIGTVAGNRALADVGTWTGLVLGFTPNAEAVAGNALIDVNLDRLMSYADFTELENWRPRQFPGRPDTGEQWRDDDPTYASGAQGNTLRSLDSGVDHGRVTGIFTFYVRSALRENRQDALPGGKPCLSTWRSTTRDRRRKWHSISRSG